MSVYEIMPIYTYTHARARSYVYSYHKPSIFSRQSVEPERKRSSAYVLFVVKNPGDVDSEYGEELYAADDSTARQGEARTTKKGVTFTGVEEKRLTTIDKIKMMMRGETLGIATSHADAEAGPVDAHKKMISAEDLGVVTTYMNTEAGPLDGHSSQTMRHLHQMVRHIMYMCTETRRHVYVY
jgi:hypothetical protein